MFMDLAFANDRTGVGYNSSLASEPPAVDIPSKETVDEIDNVSIADTGSSRTESMILTPTMNATPIASLYLPCSAESFMPLSLSSNPSSTSASPLGSQRSPTPPLFAFTRGNANDSDAMTPIQTPATFVDEPETTAVLGEAKTFVEGPSLFFDNDEDEDD
ncbi:hypothetical protein EIP86_007155 [Pleurotus ostreatoroseus]|nr:hypothetical protein EIP86_007155 [Pleurotus ostreatoroseus]